MEKNGIARQALGDNITRRTRIACWDITTTDVFSEYVIGLITALPRKNGSTKASQSYVYTYIACSVHVTLRDGKH